MIHAKLISLKLRPCQFEPSTSNSLIFLNKPKGQGLMQLHVLKKNLKATTDFKHGKDDQIANRPLVN